MQPSYRFLEGSDICVSSAPLRVNEMRTVRVELLLNFKTWCDDHALRELFVCCSVQVALHSTPDLLIEWILRQRLFSKSTLYYFKETILFQYDSQLLPTATCGIW